MGGASVRGGAASGAAVFIFSVLAITPPGAAVAVETACADAIGPEVVALPLAESERSPMVRMSFGDVLRRTSVLYDPEPRNKQRTFVHEPEQPVLEENADGKSVNLRDGALTRSTLPAPTTPSPLLTGPGLEDTSVALSFQSAEDKLGVYPPDGAGDVGPAHLLTVLNSEFIVRSRGGGLLAEPIELTAFFGAALDINDIAFDPRVVYDKLTRRWFVSAAVGGYTDNSRIALAISDNADPTGSWRFMTIQADPSGLTWADFPGLGMNSKYVVITANMWYNGVGIQQGVKAWVIDKDTLAYAEPRMTVFNPGFDSGPGYLTVQRTFGVSMMPSICDDPGENDLYLVDNTGFSDGDGTPLIRMSRIYDTGDGPAWEPVAGGPYAGTGFIRAPERFERQGFGLYQKNSSYVLSTSDSRVGASPKQREGRVYFAHHAGYPAGAPDRTATFWYETDPASMEAGAPALAQHGVIEYGPQSGAAYPSVAVNGAGDMTIGYSIGDKTMHISGAVQTRRAGDAPGTLGPAHIALPGRGQIAFPRWGDYTSTTVDPNDDRSFWTLQLFADERSDFPSATRWATGWARVGPGALFPPCIADQTTSGGVSLGFRGYGSSDGVVDIDDLAYFLGAWVISDAARADLTSFGASQAESDNAYVPDGEVGLDDLGFYVNAWLRGCP